MFNYISDSALMLMVTHLNHATIDFYFSTIVVADRLCLKINLCYAVEGFQIFDVLYVRKVWLVDVKFYFCLIILVYRFH